MTLPRGALASSARQRRLAYSAWIAVCLIWGTTYLAIRVTLESIPPWLMSGMRWTTASAILFCYLAAKGERLPRVPWRSVLFLGATLLVLGNGGVVWAEQYVPSGLAAVVVAASPFWMVAVEAMRSDGEPLRVQTIMGLAVGFSGIMLLVWPDLTAGGSYGRGFVAGVVSLQVACIGWAIGSSYSRRHARDQNVLATTAAQMLAGGVSMFVIGIALGEWRLLHFTTRTAVALSYLTTIGAVGGFVCYTYALRHLPVSLVSLYAYVNPVIAVVLGVLLLHEPFDSRMSVAAALVFAGVGIVRAPGRSAEAREGREHAPLVRAAGAPRAR
jgi:drug/metabolite transporter (DMT)-like permease